MGFPGIDVIFEIIWVKVNFLEFSHVPSWKDIVFFVSHCWVQNVRHGCITSFTTTQQSDQKWGAMLNYLSLKGKKVVFRAAISDFFHGTLAQLKKLNSGYFTKILDFSSKFIFAMKTNGLLPYLKVSEILSCLLPKTS